MSATRFQHVLWGVIVSLGLSPLMAPIAAAQSVGDEEYSAGNDLAMSKAEHIEWVVAQLNARAVLPSPDADAANGEAAGPFADAAWVVYGGGLLLGGGCSIDIALVAADSPTDTGDVQSKLLGDPRIASVTVIDTRTVTPTTNDLLAFDAVMVWTNSTPADSPALGDALANYVDAGGGVVLAMFAMRERVAARIIQGRFLADDYYCIQQSVGSATTGQASLGTVHVPGSPVMSGVRSFNGGSFAFRPPTGPTPNATRVVSWNTGEILAATRTDLAGRRVDLGFFPPSSDVSGNFWQTSTDGALLMANAMSFSAGCPLAGNEGCSPASFSQAPPNPALQSRNSNTPSNDFSTQQIADDFSISGGASISRITLWSTYTGDNSVPNAQRFVINIYNNVANNPGSVIYTAAAQVVPEYTGMIQTGFTTPRRLYRFIIDLNTPFAAAAGVTYWLSPLGNTNDKDWSWQFFSSSGSRRSRTSGTAPWTTWPANLAFELCTTCVGAAPPEVDISSPGAIACACDMVDIVGEVGDPAGTYVGDQLQYRKSTSAAWTTADEAAGPRSGVLYTWDTTALTQGYYFVRIVGLNECGLSDSDATFVYVSKSFANLELRVPADGAIVGGTAVCFDGTAWTQSCFDYYRVNYRPVGGGGWQPVDPGNPTYTSPVINDRLAFWDSTTVADGDYQVRLQGFDDCGNWETVIHTVTIDNTAPTAVITSPIDCDYVDGVIPIIGTANDANLTSWSLQYSGGGTNGWVTIASGNTPVVNGLLGNWNTTNLPICAYTLRLHVTDRAVLNCNGAIHNRSEYHVSVNVGNICDINGDGFVDARDIEPFIQCLFP